MINSRGQVGSTMTWAVATVLVVAILGVSLLLSGFISSLDGKSRDIDPDKRIGFDGLGIDYEILRVVDENYDEISLWADDGFVLSHQEWIFGEGDENLDKVCSVFETEKGSLNLDRGDFYLVISEPREVIRVTENTDGFVCGPTDSAVIADSSFSIISFSGNFLEVEYNE